MVQIKVSITFRITNCHIYALVIIIDYLQIECIIIFITREDMAMLRSNQSAQVMLNKKGAKSMCELSFFYFVPFLEAQSD